MTNKNIKVMLVKGRILIIQRSRPMKSCGGSSNNGYVRSYFISRDLSSVPRVSDWLQRDRGDRGGDAQAQKPDGVNTFMSRGLSLCGRGGGGRLASIPVISILGGMKLAGSSTFSLTCVLE